MALASMFRRSAAAAAPIAIRLLGESRHHTSADQLCRRFFPLAQHFSTGKASLASPDIWLLKVLEYANDCVLDAQNNTCDFTPRSSLLEILKDYPFKIEDIAGEQVVKVVKLQGKLDEDLHNNCYDYLYVRGITPSFTDFVHDYATYKMLREYRRWLENIKMFVKA